MDWSKYFDKIYCLSLVNNVERRQDMEKEFQRVGIDTNSGYFKWKITVDNPFYKYIWTNPSLPTEKWWLGIKGALNCTMGHYEIMMEAQALGYERILIVEDDARFLNDVSEIERYLENLPEYDICLLDFYPRSPNDKQNFGKYKETHKINELFIDYSQIYVLSCGCYALSKYGYTSLLNLQNTKYMPADHYINNTRDSIRDLKRVCPEKNISIQDMSYKPNRQPIDYHLYDGITDTKNYNLRDEKV